MADHLGRLNDTDLAALLAARPDVCVEPAPHTFRLLAERLRNRQSLANALWTLDRDAILVGQTITVLGSGADVSAIARATRADSRLVEDAVQRLGRTALIWPSPSGGYHVDELLAEHWRAELRLGSPARKLLPKLRVDELRVTAGSLGIAETGLRKPELIAAILDAMSDPELIGKTAAALPAEVHDELDEIRRNGPRYYSSPWHLPNPRQLNALVHSGLVLPCPGAAEMPCEVGLALCNHHVTQQLSGSPRLARSASDPSEVTSAAAAAAGSALSAVTALLDDARETPIGRLRSGGVGARERKRLGSRLDSSDDEVVLWIDLAHAASLLADDGTQYRPTPEYDRWRATDPGARLAELLSAWRELDHAPLERMHTDDKPVPPPLHADSAQGVLRRRLLRVCTQAPHPVSMHSANQAMHWWCPLVVHPEDVTVEQGRPVLAEAELLGVLAADTLSPLGAALADDDRQGLLDAATELLPPTGYTLTLQSDLTAMLIGDAPADLLSLLNTMAELESRGTARTWRFTPERVRAAFDAGDTADDLLDRLGEASGRGVPQPLEYLIKDVSRRHGSVTVSAAMCCVRADEARINEIMATRLLHKLRFIQLAPNVLASPKPLTEVTEALRDAGLAPATEDASGNPILENRQDARAATKPQSARNAARTALTPQELVTRLRERTASGYPQNATARTIQGMNGTLTDDEIEVLADAIDTGRAVSISYVDRNGTLTRRTISDLELDDRWIEAWCHLRNDDRVFTVSQINSVAPV